ncbi:MAG: hypothetical protein J6Q38_04375 [Clostridia bacterium]|nr:hypothetical protein [Clostridia bacterium]
MEEKVEFEKTLSLVEIMRVIRSRFIWILLIVIASVGVGVAYTTFIQKTEYTAVNAICVQAGDYTITDAEGNEIPSNIAEHTKYQYSALIAPEFEKVLKSAEILKAVKERGVNVNVSALKFNYTEESAFFEISYTFSAHGGDANVIKAQVANTLNEYVKASIEIIDDENSIYPTYLKNKLIRISNASQEGVSAKTGKTTTIILSFLVGLVLSAVLVISLYFIDDTINVKDDVEKITGLSNIALIDISFNESLNASEIKQGGN